MPPQLAGLTAYRWRWLSRPLVALRPQASGRAARPLRAQEAAVRAVCGAAVCGAAVYGAGRVRCGRARRPASPRRSTPQVLCAPLGAWLMDRRGRKYSGVAMLAGSALGYGLMAQIKGRGRHARAYAALRLVRRNLRARLPIIIITT